MHEHTYILTDSEISELYYYKIGTLEACTPSKMDPIGPHPVFIKRVSFLSGDPGHSRVTIVGPADFDLSLYLSGNI
jgi:hypothetical protein